MENKAASSPVYILNAVCTPHDEHSKKKHTFKMSTSDGSVFIFSANSDTERDDWCAKLNFHASLAPSKQLTSFNEHPTHRLVNRLVVRRGMVSYSMTCCTTATVSHAHTVDDRYSTPLASSPICTIF